MNTSFKRTTALFAVGLAVLAVSPAAAVAAPKKDAPANAPVQQQTAENLLTAMQGEAYANAKYLAFGDIARSSGDNKVSHLFTKTAKVEVGQHFAELADEASFVGSVEQNLQAAIDGESYETTTMYPTFAREAAAAGDTAAAELFTEIGADETTHAQNFQAALDSLTTGARVPAGPTASRAAVVAGGSGASAGTLANLDTAMHGESFAYAKYMAYSEQARKSGHAAIARLFERTAEVELTEHFREEGNLSGLAGDTVANLTSAIDGESYETTTMYPTFAQQAIEAGDLSAASRFLEIGADEADHRDAFAKARANATD
ncbi:rubrerythrin family protein [Raineyella sp. LH-20]|uniref:rubrerythrin family protein n=1 Tax=Raineyella sp. LH-20 TaxID=3081204 RepID=UPI00295375DD|nr:rubrerythrin family protein [Raineyella sp. LH-20]WOP17703.1 rubrerythrin family protein [Raineyella sp. LH-20]